MAKQEGLTIGTDTSSLEEVELESRPIELLAAWQVLQVGAADD